MSWKCAGCLHRAISSSVSLHHHSAILVCKQVFLIKISPTSVLGWTGEECRLHATQGRWERHASVRLLSWNVHPPWKQYNSRTLCVDTYRKIFSFLLCRLGSSLLCKDFVKIVINYIIKTFWFCVFCLQMAQLKDWVVLKQYLRITCLSH